MKIALLRGYRRLVDGESAFTEEMYNYCSDSGHEVEVFHLDIKKMVKIGSYDDGYSYPVTIFSKEMIPEILQTLNSFDKVVLINAARAYCGLGDVDVTLFAEMYKKITTKKIFTIHNHIDSTCKNMPFLDDYIMASDIVADKKENSYFHNRSKELGCGAKFRIYKIGIDTKSFFTSNNFNERRKNIAYIGRYMLYKGILLFMDRSPQIRKAGFTQTVHGMDQSYFVKKWILMNQYCENYFKEIEILKHYNTDPIVKVYGFISREKVNSVYESSLFSFNYIKMKGSIQKSITHLEYSALEAICNGCVPIFSSRFADACMINGKPISQIPNFGVIFYEDDWSLGLENLKKISENEEIYKIYQRVGYEVVKEFDSFKVLKEIVNF